MVGEFRYGLGLRNTLVGIKDGNDTPIVQFSGTPVMTAIIGNAGNFPINRYQTDHQFVYNISALLGSEHSLKAGTDIRRQALNDLADNFSRGFWTFNRDLRRNDSADGIRPVSPRVHSDVHEGLWTILPRKSN